MNDYFLFSWICLPLNVISTVLSRLTRLLLAFEGIKQEVVLQSAWRNLGWQNCTLWTDPVRTGCNLQVHHCHITVKVSTVFAVLLCMVVLNVDVYSGPKQRVTVKLATSFPAIDHSELRKSSTRMIDIYFIIIKKCGHPWQVFCG